ncbi:MAG: DHH family phosphoesterase [Oscillospiraceae bacterium]|nr:DHH family phosphoesterase [Oscillospiraceae bacterium]
MQEIIFSVKEEIEKAKKIAVTAHISEDIDALGSVFALNETLKNLGKDTTVFLSERLGDNMAFFDEEYQTDVPQNPDFDLMICLDCGDTGRLSGREKIFENAAKTINIDHHFTNTNFADINWVEGETSSTGEMLCSLIPVLSGFNKKSAAYLYAALVGDTGGFKYKNVTPKTMCLAADLLRYNINHADIVKELFDTETLAEMRLRAEIMQNVQSFFDGRVNIVIADEELFAKYGLEEKDIGGLVEIPRRIKGTEIAASMKISGEKIKLSIRSAGKVDVSGIAGAFGGGGHKMAAGGTSGCGIEETMAVFLKECENRLEKL